MQCCWFRGQRVVITKVGIFFFFLEVMYEEAGQDVVVKLDLDEKNELI